MKMLARFLPILLALVTGSAQAQFWRTNVASLTSGTITGVTINNSVIGGVTPAAGSFTTLSASDGTRTFKIASRSAAAGGLAVGTDVATSTAHILNLFGDLTGGTTAGGVYISFYAAASSTWNNALRIVNTAGTPSAATLVLMPDGGAVTVGGTLSVTGTITSNTFDRAAAGTLTLGGTATSLTVGASTITPAASGVRFLCISTTGVVASQTVACVGT